MSWPNAGISVGLNFFCNYFFSVLITESRAAYLLSVISSLCMFIITTNPSIHVATALDIIVPPILQSIQFITARYLAPRHPMLCSAM